MSKQLANIALQIMAEARVNADDQTLAAVAQTRAMLRNIVTGKLVVVEPPKVDPPVPPSTGVDG